MPNWVATQIQIEGPIDVLQSIYNRCEEADGFSFDLFVPIPKELEINENKEAAVFVWDRDHPVDDSFPPKELRDTLDLICTWEEALERGKQLYTECGALLDQTGLLTQEQFVEQGVQTLRNIKTYGFCSWHDWCIANWGTKWDVNECELSEPATNPTSGKAKIELYFNTAWSFPKHIIQAISEQYPDITISGDYADEDVGSNCGSFVGKAGVVIVTDRSGDIGFANSLWDFDLDDDD